MCCTVTVPQESPTLQMTRDESRELANDRFAKLCETTCCIDRAEELVHAARMIDMATDMLMGINPEEDHYKHPAEQVLSAMQVASGFGRSACIGILCCLFADLPSDDQNNE